MNRKKFLKNVFLTGVFGAIAPQALKAEESKPTNSTYDKLMQQVGFNHLPNKNIKTMNTIIHKAETRGHANHGWLNSPYLQFCELPQSRQNALWCTPRIER